jgi:hypothetical protein
MITGIELCSPHGQTNRASGWRIDMDETYAPEIVMDRESSTPLY